MAQRGAEQRRPSIHDVASRAGVSAATVSKVMQGVTTVRPENAQRVFDAVQLLGYRVDPLASDLRRAKRRIIGAIVPEFESEFFGSMVTQLERLAEQRGYALIAASSRESEARERDILDRMHDWRVSGVVLSPVRNEHGPAAELMKKYGMTGVMIDRVLADDVFDTVAADSAGASAEVARALVGKGHRHILVVGLGEQAATVKARLDGFRATAMELAPDVRIDVILAESDVEPLRASLSRLFRQGRAADRGLFAVPQGHAGGAQRIPPARLALPERRVAGRLRRCRMDAGDVAGDRRRRAAGQADGDPGDGHTVSPDRRRGGAARRAAREDARS